MSYQSIQFTLPQEQSAWNAPGAYGLDKNEHFSHYCEQLAHRLAQYWTYEIDDLVKTTPQEKRFTKSGAGATFSSSLVVYPYDASGVKAYLLSMGKGTNVHNFKAFGSFLLANIKNDNCLGMIKAIKGYSEFTFQNLIFDDRNNAMLDKYLSSLDSNSTNNPHTQGNVYKKMTDTGLFKIASNSDKADFSDFILNNYVGKSLHLKENQLEKCFMILTQTVGSDNIRLLLDYQTKLRPADGLGSDIIHSYSLIGNEKFFWGMYLCNIYGLRKIGSIVLDMYTEGNPEEKIAARKILEAIWYCDRWTPIQDTLSGSIRRIFFHQSNFNGLSGQQFVNPYALSIGSSINQTVKQEVEPKAIQTKFIIKPSESKVVDYSTFPNFEHDQDGFQYLKQFVNPSVKNNRKIDKILEDWLNSMDKKLEKKKTNKFAPSYKKAKAFFSESASLEPATPGREDDSLDSQDSQDSTDSIVDILKESRYFAYTFIYFLLNASLKDIHDGSSLLVFSGYDSIVLAMIERTVQTYSLLKLVGMEDDKQMETVLAHLCKKGENEEQKEDRFTLKYWNILAQHGFDIGSLKFLKGQPMTETTMDFLKGLTEENKHVELLQCKQQLVVLISESIDKYGYHANDKTTVKPSMFPWPTNEKLQAELKSYEKKKKEQELPKASSKTVQDLATRSDRSDQSDQEDDEGDNMLAFMISKLVTKKNTPVVVEGWYDALVDEGFDDLETLKTGLEEKTIPNDILKSGFQTKLLKAL